MISFVYFDVGGVAIKDFSGSDKWAVMKRDLGVTVDIDKPFSQLFDKYELEELGLTRDVDTLIPIFIEKFGLNFSPGYSMLTDFVNRFEKNISLWSVLDKIQKTCRVGLLTNMYPRMLDAIQKHDLLPPISWNVTIDSSKIGYIKPQKEIFQIAEEASGVSRDKIFFVDNSEININAAKKYGWQTFLYDSANPEESSRKLSARFKDI